MSFSFCLMAEILYMILYPFNSHKFFKRKQLSKWSERHSFSKHDKTMKFDISLPERELAERRTLNHASFQMQNIPFQSV